MRKVLLVKCSQNVQFTTGITYPLGLMYIASALREKRDDTEIKIVDLRANQQDYRELEQVAASFKPDYVGLSAITMEAPSMNKAADTIRKTDFEGPIIAGGPHPTAFPEEALICKDIDYLVLGEGEATFSALIDSLESGRDPHSLPGTACRQNGGVVKTGVSEFIQDLDAIPEPAVDLIDVDLYATFNSMSALRSGKFMNLFTSRACPFQCTYCHSLFGKKFRAQSPERVVSEVLHNIERYGITHFEVLDDFFNCDLDRSKRIFDLLLDTGIKISLSFPNGLRCDHLDREFLEKLAKFEKPMISVPVESASPRIQKMIKKNLNLQRVTETINLCADLHIYTRGFFMLGFPTETKEEIERTVNYAVKSKLHSAFFFIVVPFKGTELYKDCLQILQERGYRYEDHDYFRSPMNVSTVPDSVLHGAQRWAYVRLLTRPSRILRLIRDFPDYRFIWRGIKAMAEFFFGAGKGLRPGKADIAPGTKFRKPTS